MKIYYFSDNNFLDMKNSFEESFKDDFNKQYKFIKNINLDKTKPGSGIDIWKYKTEMIIDAIKENMNTNETIIISDIDIIFYKPVIPTIKKHMINNDICFQKEREQKGVNIGFMAMNCNDVTLTFWTTVYDILCTSNKWDQQIVNELIYKTKYNIKWKRFNRKIWNWTQRKLNKHIILHHANCASTKEAKYKQMKHVKEFISKNK